MTMIRTALAATALAFALSTGALADPAATAPATTTKPAKVEAAAKPRSAQSIECSKQADAKGLHGKPRKEFRKTCIKSAPKAN